MRSKIEHEIHKNNIKLEELKEEMRKRLALIYGNAQSELGEIKRQQYYIPRDYIKEIQKLGNEIAEISCIMHTLKENNEVLKGLMEGR